MVVGEGRQRPVAIPGELLGHVFLFVSNCEKILKHFPVVLYSSQFFPSLLKQNRIKDFSLSQDRTPSVL